MNKVAQKGLKIIDKIYAEAEQIEDELSGFLYSIDNMKNQFDNAQYGDSGWYSDEIDEWLSDFVDDCKTYSKWFINIGKTASKIKNPIEGV